MERKLNNHYRSRDELFLWNKIAKLFWV